MLVLSSSLLFTSMLFLSSNHPLMMGFLLILTSLVYAIMMYILSVSSWLTYILIMVFVSGAMVMFIYMASLSSNEPMNMNMKSFITLLSITTAYMLVLFILMKQMKNNNQMISSIDQFMKEHSMELVYKTYNVMLMETTVILTLYLLITLIVAMNIIKFSKKPLRSFK